MDAELTLLSRFLGSWLNAYLFQMSFMLRESLKQRRDGPTDDRHDMKSHGVSVLEISNGIISGAQKR